MDKTNKTKFKNPKTNVDEKEKERPVFYEDSSLDEILINFLEANKDKSPEEQVKAIIFEKSMPEEIRKDSLFAYIKIEKDYNAKISILLPLLFFEDNYELRKLALSLIDSIEPTAVFSIIDLMKLDKDTVVDESLTVQDIFNFIDSKRDIILENIKNSLSNILRESEES